MSIFEVEAHPSISSEALIPVSDGIPDIHLR